MSFQLLQLIEARAAQEEEDDEDDEQMDGEDEQDDEGDDDDAERVPSSDDPVEFAGEIVSLLYNGQLLEDWEAESLLQLIAEEDPAIMKAFSELHSTNDWTALYNALMEALPKEDVEEEIDEAEEVEDGDDNYQEEEDDDDEDEEVAEDDDASATDISRHERLFARILSELYEGKEITG